MEPIINRGYKFKIIPTNEQKEFFLQSFGCARKIYNMYINELYKQLEETGYQNGFCIKRIYILQILQNIKLILNT